MTEETEQDWHTCIICNHAFVMLPSVTLVFQSVISHFFWRWNSYGNEKKTNIIFQKGKYPKLMLTPELLQLKAKFWVTQTFR